MLLYSMPKTDSICVVLTVFNEEHHVTACIQNARRLTDTIIVVDTESTDDTARLAAKEGVPVYSFPYKRYVEPSRNFAIGKAKADWVFILDADERLPDPLIREIKEVVSNTEHSYFKVGRNNIFAGRWPLTYGGWNSDSIIRLIRKRDFIEWPEAIHSTPKIKGSLGYLKNVLDHHFHPNLENMVSKTALFENMESQLLFEAKRDASVPIFFRKFFGELYRRLIKGEGYKDKTPGVIEAVYQAYSKTVTYLYVYEKKLHEKSSTL